LKAQDFPIEHFSLMAEVATLLKEQSAQVLEHHYDYRAFGSWHIEFLKQGKPSRLIFDGRDSIITLEESNAAVWKPIRTRHLESQSRETYIDEIHVLLNLVED
jgi:hypothetical protein